MQELPGEKLIAPVVKDIYGDALAPLMKQVGALGESAAKTMRLALFPFQLTAAAHDVLTARLAQRVKAAIDQVPEGRLMAAREAILLPVASQLRYQDEGPNQIADLYVNLLARAMDRERVGEAHPAFVQLIGQLAPDEVWLFELIAAQPQRMYLQASKGEQPISRHVATAHMRTRHLGEQWNEKIAALALDPADLAQPELFLTFLEHLVSLGLVEYTNEVLDPETRDISFQFLGITFHYVCLTAFGRLFLRACVSR